MQKPLLNPEDWIITLDDVKQLYILKKKKLFWWAVLGGAFSFLWFGSAEVGYRAVSTFKENTEKAGSEGFFQDIVGSISGAATQPQAASIMRSNQVLKPVIEKLGMQITPCSSSSFILAKIQKYKEGLKAERGKKLKDVDTFRFSNVFYEKEDPLSFYLQFQDENQFVVLDELKKTVLSKGEVGAPVFISGCRFTLEKKPSVVLKNRLYKFSCSHWIHLANRLRKQIEIEKDLDNRSLLNLSFKDRDRHLAQNLINELMEEYRSYLKKEYDRIAEEQLTYLEKKQEQIFSKMDVLFHEHQKYLEENLEKNGFIGLQQESESLLVPYQTMYSKVLAINVELDRLEKMIGLKRIIAPAEEGPFSHQLSTLMRSISDLKSQKTLLELSLCHDEEQNFDLKKEELSEVKNERFKVESLLEMMRQGSVLASCDQSDAIYLWAKKIKEPEEKKVLEDYLEEYRRALSTREKILQNRFFHGSQVPSELEAIDSSSAKELYLSYNTKLDESEASIRHLTHLRKAIENIEFDLSALGATLKDSLSQKLIGEASSLELLLKDDRHHSEKEETKWKKEIALNRKILSCHLEQLIELEKLNNAVIREKMSGLQKINLESLNEQISLLNEQAIECVKQRKDALILEKKLLTEKMQEFRTSLANLLPGKWNFEKWLEIKTDMITKTIETITQIVESKTLSKQMHHVESKVLDLSLLSSVPEKPRIGFISLCGAFFLSFTMFVIAFLKKAMDGFPLSLKKLEALKLPLCGTISSFCDGPPNEPPSGADLDALRTISLFSAKGKVISLIGGNKGPDYSYFLGENVGRRGEKSIVLRCDFSSKSRGSETPGLLQFLEKKVAALPILKKDGYDFVYSGGFTPFGIEKLQSDLFSSLLESLKEKYDLIYLFFKTPLASAESMAALSLCDRAVVTVSKEKIEELTPFIDWGYDEDCCRITFLIAT